MRNANIVCVASMFARSDRLLLPAKIVMKNGTFDQFDNNTRFQAQASSHTNTAKIATKTTRAACKHHTQQTSCNDLLLSRVFFGQSSSHYRKKGDKIRLRIGQDH